MNEKITYGIILVLLLLVLSNFIKPVSIGQAYYYKTLNSEFEFRAVPSKGSNEAFMEVKFQEFLSENPETADTVLYRTFRMNYIHFWKWYEYGTHERWKYPYIIR